MSARRRARRTHAALATILALVAPLVAGCASQPTSPAPAHGATGQPASQEATPARDATVEPARAETPDATRPTPDGASSLARAPEVETATPAPPEPREIDARPKPSPESDAATAAIETRRESPPVAPPRPIDDQREAPIAVTSDVDSPRSPTAAPPPSQAPAQASVLPPPPPGARDVTQIAPVYSEGLEVAWWITKDADDAAGAFLASLPPRPHPMDDATRARWERAGFRVLSIDESDVRTILETLEPVGRVERDWVGLKSKWTECFRPPAEARLDARPIVGLPRPVAPGQLRLIARAWLAPKLDAAVLRLDLAAQHHLPTDVFAQITLDQPTLPRAENEGDVFADATAEIAMRPGQVLLITGETPGAVWGEGERPEPSSRRGAIPAEQFDPAIATGAVGGVRGEAGAEFGPPVVRPQTPGEAMLEAETSAIFPGPTRTILLLIPRVPDEYSLLVR